jgi:hypothetical protein
MPDLPEWSIVMTIEDQENLIALGTVCHRAYVRHRRLARPVRGRRDGGRPRWLSVLLVLCRSQPRPRRPFWLPAASLLAALAFIRSNWIIYWDRLRDRLVPVRTAGGRLRDLCGSTTTPQRKPGAEFGWRSIAWLLPWFGGMWVLSLLGDIGGGLGWLGSWPPSRASPCGA